MDSPRLDQTPKKARAKTPQKRKRAEDTITTKAVKYFVKGSETDFSKDSSKTHICCICDTQINGSKEWNLAQHLRKCHLEIYEELVGQRDTPEVMRLKFMQNCVEIVSVNGRPSSSLLDSGFQRIVKSKLDELRTAGCPVNISHPNLMEVKSHLEKTAQQIQYEITKETQNKPLSLMVDIVTRQRRSICGFSVQYNLNGELKIRSVGMVELLKSHTGKYIAEVIIARLKDFGIKLKQIVTITTDNGSNVLKMVRDVNDHLQIEINRANQIVSDDRPESNEPEIVNQDTDSLIERLLSNEREITEYAFQQLFQEVDFNQDYSTILSVMTAEFSSYEPAIWDITGVNCAAHTLQLAIKDALSKLTITYQNVIGLCRCVCKFLRLKSTSVTLDAVGMEHIIPRLETDTRWGSMYLMVRCMRFNFLFGLCHFFIFIHVQSIPIFYFYIFLVQFSCATLEIASK